MSFRFTAPVTRVCAHCGEFFPAGRSPRASYCSTQCRRDAQNERRREERREEAERRRVVLFCSVCGVPRLHKPKEDEFFRYCSRCCARIAQSRRDAGLPEANHKPNYILAAALFPQRDPWEAGDMTEEEAEDVLRNSLQDGGQAEGFFMDDIEYYKTRIEAAYSAGFEEWVQNLLNEEPSPAEQAEVVEG